MEIERPTPSSVVRTPYRSQYCGLPCWLRPAPLQNVEFDGYPLRCPVGQKSERLTRWLLSINYHPFPTGFTFSFLASWLLTSVDNSGNFVPLYFFSCIFLFFFVLFCFSFSFFWFYLYGVTTGPGFPCNSIFVCGLWIYPPPSIRSTEHGVPG